MPVYVRPRLAIIEESGSGPGALLAAAAAVLAAAAVVTFILGHLALLAIAAAVVAGGTLAVVAWLKRYTVIRHEAPGRPGPAGPRLSAVVLPRGLAVTAGRPAIEAAPARHLHLHFGPGMDAAEVAAIIAQADTAARLAIEKE